METELSAKQVDRFWSNCKLSGDCLLWQRFVDRSGYGILRINGVAFRAHRIAYSLATGGDIVRAQVYQKCGNPRCCNPEHLDAPSPDRESRRCRSCGEEKRLTSFNIIRNGMRGNICHSCRAARAVATEAGRRRKRDRERRWQQKNPKKVRAALQARAAIADGIIQRLSCEVCGDTRAQAHHDDYNQPLVVRFLCQAHHAAWHAQNGEGLNAHEVGDE